jgi:hypothetical protein
VGDGSGAAQAQAQADDEAEEAEAQLDVTQLAAAVAGHPSLTALELSCYQEAGYGVALDAEVLGCVVRLALARRLRGLRLRYLELAPGCLLHLAQLLLETETLEELALTGSDDGTQLQEEPAHAAALAGALRSNATLTSLSLCQLQLWEEHNVALVPMLLTTLTGHASLRTLSLDTNGENEYEDAEEEEEDGEDEGEERVQAKKQLRQVASAMAALVAAAAPALTSLSVVDAPPSTLAALLDALPRNRNLRTLACGTCYRDCMTEAFARSKLLPAVRACGSLRSLTVSMGSHGLDEEPVPKSVRAAVALVAARGAAA